MNRLSIGAMALLGSLSGCADEDMTSGEPRSNHSDAGVPTDNNGVRSCYIESVEVGSPHPDARSGVARVINLANIATTPVTMNFGGDDCTTALADSDRTSLILRVESATTPDGDSGVPLTDRVARNIPIDLVTAEHNGLTLTTRLDLRGVFSSAGGGRDYGAVNFILRDSGMPVAYDRVDVNTAVPAIEALARDIPLSNEVWDITFVNHGERDGIIRIADIDPNGDLTPWGTTAGSTVNCRYFGDASCATGYTCAPRGPIGTPLANSVSRVCTEDPYVITIPPRSTVHWPIPATIRAELLSLPPNDRNIDMRYVTANAAGNEQAAVQRLEISVEE